MGALAPISTWSPEDDLLLKNAVEDGASLESLAKGAVRFSRSFTFQELEDRWHSLLYNPDVSLEASYLMVNISCSALNLSSKPNRSGNSRGNGCAFGKRNAGSVRSHYYAMKRIRREYSNTIDVFVDDFNCTGNEGGIQEHLTHYSEPESQNFIFGKNFSNHIGLQESDLDIACHALQETGGYDPTVGHIEDPVHEFHAGHLDSFGDGLPHEMIGEDCLYGFPDDVSPVSVNEVTQTGSGHAFEHDGDVYKHLPFQQNLAVFGNYAGAHEVGPQLELPVSNIFETDDVEAKPLSSFDSSNGNPGNVCPGFGGSQGFNSPVSDCGATFHQLGYSSPLAVMPSWEPTDGISTSTLQIETNLGDKDLVLGDAFACAGQGGAERIGSPNCEIVYSETKLKSADGLANSTAPPEGDFMCLSSSLFNELLSMEIDGDEGVDGDVKDIMGSSCLDGLNSILFSSPSETHQDDVPGASKSKASVPHNACLVAANDPCTEDSSAIGYASCFGQEGGHKVCKIESNILVKSASAPNPHSPECINGVICCMLNTEDPEIPDNDNIFPSTETLPCSLSPFTPHGYGESCSMEASVPLDTRDAQTIGEQGFHVGKGEEETPAQRLLAPRMIRSQILAEMGPNHAVDGCVVKSELLEIDSPDVVSNHRIAATGELYQCRHIPVTPNFVPDESVKNSAIKSELGEKHDFTSSVDPLLEKSGRVPDHGGSCPQNILGVSKQADMLVTTLHAELESTEMAFQEPGLDPLTAEHEDQLSGSDSDIPYFSDVEAMILEMDLGLDDQDSHLSREALRYQNKDTKRTIIRLEQVVKSYMQRAMASHRAFAIFYGRHLKHYIKKSEVILGRATNDLNVDIDLGREGRANKISRRQAMIKMDQDGSFYLKNLSKYPIYVNSKEVAIGQRLSLNSCCLIEIRGMRFMFEKFQHSSRS